MPIEMDGLRVYTLDDSRGDRSLSDETWKQVRREMVGVDDSPPPMLPSEGLKFWAAEAQKRIADHYDAVIVIDGPEGRGKSNLAISFGMLIDPTMTGASLKDRIAYTAEDVIRGFQTLRAGQVIIFDESSRALISTETFSPEQRALVNALFLCREKGLVVILCIPDVMRLAKSVRARRSWLLVRVITRGLARVFIREDRMLDRLDDDSLGMVEAVWCPLLQWTKLPPELDRIYLSIKSAKLKEFLAVTLQMLEQRSKKRPGASSTSSGSAPESVPQKYPSFMHPNEERPVKPARSPTKAARRKTREDEELRARGTELEAQGRDRKEVLLELGIGRTRADRLLGKRKRHSTAVSRARWKALRRTKKAPRTHVVELDTGQKVRRAVLPAPRKSAKAPKKRQAGGSR